METAKISGNPLDEEMKIVEKQLDEMLPDIRKSVLALAKKALADDYLKKEEKERYMSKGNSYVFIKCVLTAYMDCKPYDFSQRHDNFRSLIKKLKKVNYYENSF